MNLDTLNVYRNMNRAQKMAYTRMLTRFPELASSIYGPKFNRMTPKDAIAFKERFQLTLKGILNFIEKYDECHISKIVGSEYYKTFMVKLGHGEKDSSSEEEEEQEDNTSDDEEEDEVLEDVKTRYRTRRKREEEVVAVPGAESGSLSDDDLPPKKRRSRTPSPQPSPVMEPLELPAQKEEPPSTAGLKYLKVSKLIDGKEIINYNFPTSEYKAVEQAAEIMSLSRILGIRTRVQILDYNPDEPPVPFTKFAQVIGFNKM